MASSIHDKFFPKARPIVRGAIPPTAEIAAKASAERARAAQEMLDTKIAGGEPPARGTRSKPASTPPSRYEPIIEYVCDKYGVTRPMLMGRNRDPDVILALREAVTIMHRQVGMNSCEIGRVLGGRDHTTILLHLRHSGIHQRFRPGESPHAVAAQ
jgi:hypothetical protein